MPRQTTASWERQKGESEKAYEAFVVYRDMGENRTDVAVADKLQKSCTLIRRWKKLWDWAERVRAYDNELEKQAKAEIVKARKDMIKRHVDIASQLLDKAVIALENLRPEEMTIKDIRACIKLGTELERITQGIAENDISKEQEENKTSLADMVTAAYLRRKESSIC